MHMNVPSKLLLGQHKKPFTDGGVVNASMRAVAETLLEGKQNQELCDKCQCHLPQRKVKY